MTVIAVTRSYNDKLDLFNCKNKEEAKELVSSMYNTFKKNKKIDLNNTFISDDNMYAQVANGLEITEIRVGELV